MTVVEPGEVLAGKYRVTKVLGVGGMGVVVSATHIALDEPVALKFMLPSALSSLEAIARFVREARAAVKLRSEHVARVSDVGTLETGAPYIVMEFLQGTDLSDLLEKNGPLPPDVAVEYVLHACDAMAEAHAMGIIHRDLKPSNLFLTHRKDGTPLVKVLDFGISKSSALHETGGGALTKSGAIIGSPQYMSPEQTKSAKDTDVRADIWGLGIILYELLRGRPPFEGETVGAMMASVLTETPAPLSTVRSGLPQGLSEVVDRCLEKDRERRWSTVAQLAAALSPYAPARALSLVERISIVSARGSSPELAPSASGDPDVTRAATPDGDDRAGVQTGVGWGTTSNVRQRSRRRLALVVGAGVATFAAVAAVGLVLVRTIGTTAVVPPAPAFALVPPPEPAQSTPPPAAAVPWAPVSAAAEPASPAPPSPPPTSAGRVAVPSTPPLSASAGTRPPAPTAKPSTTARPNPPKAKPGLLDTSN